MSVLLIGHWDGDTLTLTESHDIADGDQAQMDDILDRPDAGELWANEFLVDCHSDAVQRAYEQETAPGCGRVVDEVWGFAPTR